ncbi:alanine--glyoxylate aminotransferase family protein [Planomicrobium sp. CPCC 101079]|uniref:pyridoxal-phosphate-dependent aminotransferase family protein n=1 Tax=Planomicrobium sp. CPCC 101079 TaxID=2599618 RepID=UPI0011B5E4D2|nr:alanine--glyoxylate aminotransferase family protein [Planomicrobium sp. CPCC 101079]TWT02403.1 alanine--glyoxylate aminotransferase family protein [Planomicrobium sp. CPCC 101079]
MQLDQQILRIPGPTPLPPSVVRAMNHPMHSHSGEETAALMKKLEEKIKPVFGTSQEVAIIGGSGTAGLETAVANAVKPGDEVAVIVTGAFGERFMDICGSYGIKAHRFDVEWGRAANPSDVKEFLQQHKNAKAVFITHSETSTGVLNPVAELAEAIREANDALVIVDGVSSTGGTETEMDEWGVDFFITSSQKSMMLAPGLAFVAISKRAWKTIEANGQPRFYFDLLKYRESMAKNTTPFTPSLSLMYGLDRVLDLMHAEGLKNVYKRHELMKNMTRTAFKALDIPLLADDAAASPTVTAVKPKDFKAEDLKKILKEEFNLEVASGLQKLEGEIFRIGHMGYCTPADMLQAISAIEIGLHKLGKHIPYGAGTIAAQQVYISQKNS